MELICCDNPHIVILNQLDGKGLLRHSILSCTSCLQEKILPAEQGVATVTRKPMPPRKKQRTMKR
jgi:hypothetical protein